jgi:tricorn protease
VRFKKIYRGANFDESRRGPLGEPGVDVRDGDFLLAIDDKPVNKNVNPNSLLVDKVGRTVILTVNSTASPTGARTVRVRPIGSEAQVRYYDFVESNRKWVAEKSGGRIGYMHIPNTQFEGAVEFTRGYWSQVDKDAMIVDERWNGGGYIQPWFVDTLARKIKAGIQVRNAKEHTADSVAIEGPKVMLINGYAGSGGDFFPWMFRAEKVGPLIGTRTWGGLVGISGGAPLLDGGGVTAPEFSIYDRETMEIIAENQGIAPDIEVDARPDLIAAGRDPQLEKAVEVLMDQLKKNPPKKKGSTIPKVGKNGRIGG